MNLIFIETPTFSRVLPEYLDDEGFRDLQQSLIAQPDAGQLIPGTGGFRKLRWQDERRGKGRRGGLRVIYYFLNNYAEIWLFTIYGKDEAIDLTSHEKQILKRAMQSELQSREKRK